MTNVHFHLGERSAARQLVVNYHYSRRFPSSAQVIGTWHLDGGLFGDSGDAVAACIFGMPATSRWRVTPLELVRLVKQPGYPDISLSGLVSTTAKWAHRAGWPLLISYADATQGHHGGIYQACSWNYHGQRPADVDGVYVGGEFIPARTCNARWGTNSVKKLRERGVDADAHMAQGKHLYWRSNGRAGRRAAELLGLQSIPYVKPDEVAA